MIAVGLINASFYYCDPQLKEKAAAARAMSIPGRRREIGNVRYFLPAAALRG
jgi:hypothetical protein